MKKFHIAIAVSDIGSSVADYSKRLQALPEIIIEGEYALWRTDILNFSIRKTQDRPGTVRHIGFEDSTACVFSEEKDVNGLLWENFTAQDQLAEIHSIWPQAKV